jgi:glycosyltransferase involved in cell wall biosynthesis
MYDEHRWGVVRKLLGNKIARLIAGSQAVMAGSRYLFDYAMQYNNTVVYIPTVVDLDRYVGRSKDLTLKPFTIGWIGSPSTSDYLVGVVEPLKEIGREGIVRLIAIGAKQFSIEGVEVEIRAWDEDKEVQDLLECDVGIMPLPVTNWAKGKCGFKLIQYMACGLPVIASPVGANNDVVKIECGLLASGHHQWVDALRKLRDNPELRKSMGQVGRLVVEAEYSTTVVATKIIELILSIYNLNKSCAV